MAGNNLTSEKIQQLLAAVGAKPAADGGQNKDAPEYNWRQSHYFGQDQLKKLGDFTEKAAQNCGEKFTQLYHSNFNVTIASTTQHFAAELTASDKNQNEYYLGFGTKDKAFGLVGIPTKTAVLWAAQLLGDSKSAENSDRELSQLEQSLLFDIALGIIKAFSKSNGDLDLQPVGEIVKGQMPLQIDDAQEICKITFSAKKSDSETASEAYFLILCDKLNAVTGQKVQTGDNLSAQNISRAMNNYIQDIPVPVTVKLAHTMFNFQEIMSIQVDDILMFDKKVNEPVELIVQGQTVLRGRLAKSDDKRAVVIQNYTVKK
jgi:flagellar motor switch protein FliM